MSDSNEAEIDARLGALLAMDEPAPDPLFTHRVLSLVDADRRLAAARRAAWRRFGVEAAAAAAVGVSVVAMMHFGDADWILTPGLAASLALFAFVGLGQAGTARS